MRKAAVDDETRALKGSTIPARGEKGDRGKIGIYKEESVP